MGFGRPDGFGEMGGPVGLVGQLGPVGIGVLWGGPCWVGLFFPGDLWGADAVRAGPAVPPLGQLALAGPLRPPWRVRWAHWARRVRRVARPAGPPERWPRKTMGIDA